MHEEGLLKIIIENIENKFYRQRPSAWISFEEVRSICLNYNDYKILAL